MKNRSISRSCLTVPLLVVGCTQVKVVPNPDHCARNEGDRYCGELFPELPYCNHGRGECSIGDRYGCVAEVAAECHEPCGVLEDGECESGESTGSETGTGTGTGTESESGSGESSTTGPVPCVGDEDCVDEGVPFCDVGSGECVACDGVEDPDGACAGVDPTRPVCLGGTCVQCTPETPLACSGMTPVCDAATNTCVPCTAHDQCGGAACNLFNGACLPMDAVVHVGGPKSDFSTLGAAVANFGSADEGTIVVHAGTYNEAITVDAERVLAFLAAPTELPEWLRTMDPNAPQLTVDTGSTVLLDGLQLSGNDSPDDPAALVDGGRAWLDRGRVVQNSGGGIVAQSNAELVLRNCFVGGADNSAAVSVDTATARITFSTLGGDVVNATGLSCTSPNDLEVRNSIIVALGIEATGGVDVACTVADISFSATELDFAGMGNVTVGELPLMTPEEWFVGYGTGDFHLQNDGLTVFADIALRQAGDPPTDIEGDPRPVEGTPDYAGADVPVMAAGRLEVDQ